MPNFFPPSCQPVFRAAVLFGVFVGLLFSCGEGIRLFPFPPEASQKNHSLWKSGESVDYQKNLHRFENRQGNQQAKIQRDKQLYDWTNNYSALNVAPFLSLLLARRGDVLFDTRFFKSSFFPFDGASRAPPLRS